MYKITQLNARVSIDLADHTLFCRFSAGSNRIRRRLTKQNVNKY